MADEQPTPEEPKAIIPVLKEEEIDPDLKPHLKNGLPFGIDLTVYQDYDPFLQIPRELLEKYRSYAIDLRDASSGMGGIEEDLERRIRQGEPLRATLIKQEALSEIISSNISDIARVRDGMKKGEAWPEAERFDYPAN